MSVLITSRIINNVIDQRASLGNDQVLRLIDVGNTWNKIRLALRLSINTTATISGTPRFYFGMCDGTDSELSGAGSMTTAEFVGIFSTSATWNYSSLATPSVVTGTVQACRRVATTNTLSGSENLTLTTDPANYRCFLAVTIDRTTPAASTVEIITIFNSVSGVYDVSLTAFFEQLKSENVMTLTDYAQDVFAGTFNLTGSNLDSVNVSYTKTPNRIEICDFAYHVFS
jgi:hypothetical protein